MQTVSLDFVRACFAGSKRVLSKVDIRDPGGAVLYTATEEIEGSVTDDSTQSVRRSGKVSFVDVQGVLTPNSADSLLAPLGNEVAMYRGFRFPDGTEEYCPMGVMGIGDYQIDFRTISCNLYDRAERIARARWTYPFSVYKGQDLGVAINAILYDRWPDCPAVVSYVTATLTASGTYLPDAEGDDPWTSAQALAAAHGAVLYFDATGTPIVNAIPDPTKNPDVIAFERGPQGVVIKPVRGANNQATYSGVVVRGESTDGTIPISSTLWDTDPTSPTYYAGKYGMVPYFFASQYITTQLQADSVAYAFLPRVTGILEDCSWDQLTFPQLESGDIITATDDVVGLEGKYSISSLVSPLGVGHQSAVLRSRPLWTG